MTLLYLPATTAAPAISPAYHAEWDANNGVRLLASLTKTGTLNTSHSYLSTLGVNTDACLAQMLYALPTGIAFTTSDTIWGQARTTVSNGNANMRFQVIIRVLDSLGTTVRATLYGGDLATLTGNPPSEWDTFATNRQMPRGGPVPVAANYTTVAGDWLCIEIGYRKHTTGTTYTGNLRLQDDPLVADLPLNETTQTTMNPWIEFSTDLVNPPAAATRRRQALIS